MQETICNTKQSFILEQCHSHNYIQNLYNIKIKSFNAIEIFRCMVIVDSTSYQLSCLRFNETLFSKTLHWTALDEGLYAHKPFWWEALEFLFTILWSPWTILGQTRTYDPWHLDQIIQICKLLPKALDHEPMVGTMYIYTSTEIACTCEDVNWYL
jgi:hypothetical protein